MKRTLTTPSLFLSILLLFVTFSACKKQNTSISFSGETDGIATSKPNTYPQVNLSVTVNDANGNKVISDGSGAYINGSAKVSAVIDQYGNFIFSCGSSGHGPNATPDRWLNYDFSDPLPGYSTGNSERGAYIATIKSLVVPNFTPLQNLAIGNTQCVAMAMGLYTLANGVVNFHRNIEDTNTTPTAFVYVTKTDAVHWTLAPVPPSSGGCSSISNIAALRINTELYGYYNMPFSLTLTKL
jgi:hypothetical protein